MSINRPEGGFKEPIRGSSIAFEYGGSIYSLPDWDLLADEAFRGSPLATLRPYAQVVWLAEGAVEAGRIIGGIALGAKVISIDSIRPDRRGIVVYGPEFRHRAAYVESLLNDPILLWVGDERSAPSLPPGRGGADRSIKLIGDNYSQAAVLAGLLAAVSGIWPGSSARDLAQILVYMAELK